MSKVRFALILAATLFTVGSSSALAADLTVLVAPKDTPAYEHASSVEDESTVFAERRVHKAFDRAAAHLAGCGACTVNIKVSHGTFMGKGSTGHWSFPDTIAPEATLRILGGYDDTFTKRTPFATPTVLQTSTERAQEVLRFEGKKHALKELYISGLVIDAAPGNKYDGKTNSLLKSTSCTRALVRFGPMTVQRVVIADNVFINAAEKGMEPLFRAASDSAEIIVRNNLFANNLRAYVVKSASFRHKPGRYVLDGNSFILNWPYNPDPTTATPAAVEIGDKYTASSVVIQNNLFAFNVGGAIQPGYDDTAGPKIAIEDNLFFSNGILFGSDSAGMGAIVGKFNGAATHHSYDAEDVEDDFSWDVEDNTSFDPKVPVSLVTPGTVDNNAITAQKTLMNDVRSLFGANVDGGTVAISDFAPRMGLDPAQLPLPADDKAKKYGINPSRVEQF